VSRAIIRIQTVIDNVAYGLRAQRWPRSRIKTRVQEMLEIVRMTGFAERFPRALSGGQQQRVALARALAIEPQLLLLDEPFGALDKSLRLEMQIEVRRVQQTLGITCVLVTHDQEEAMSLADRIAVMQTGTVAQCGSARDIYDRPSAPFVSSFVGTTNLLSATLDDERDGVGLFTLSDGSRFEAQLVGPCRRQGSVLIALRPEYIEIVDPGSGAFDGVVRMVMPLGPLTHLSIENGAGATIRVAVIGRDRATSMRAGERVGLAIRRDAPCATFVP